MRFPRNFQHSNESQTDLVDNGTNSNHIYQPFGFSAVELYIYGFMLDHSTSKLEGEYDSCWQLAGSNNCSSPSTNVNPKRRQTNTLIILEGVELSFEDLSRCCRR